jgi:hypothetical protein
MTMGSLQILLMDNFERTFPAALLETSLLSCLYLQPLLLIS